MLGRPWKWYFILDCMMLILFIHFGSWPRSLTSLFICYLFLYSLYVSSRIRLIYMHNQIFRSVKPHEQIVFDHFFFLRRPCLSFMKSFMMSMSIQPSKLRNKSCLITKNQIKKDELWFKPMEMAHKLQR